MTGMLWVARGDILASISDAIRYFRGKYATLIGEPSLVYVSEKSLTKATAIDGIRVEPVPFLPKMHLIVVGEKDA